MHVWVEIAGKVSSFSPNHFVRLNEVARADILWWKMFVEEWNGVSLAWASSLPDPDVCVLLMPSASGAVGLIGYPLVCFAVDTTLTGQVHSSERTILVVSAAIFGKL